MMSIIFDLMDTTLSESSEKKPGSRAGRPNYPRELRDRVAAAACEPGVSVARIARENGINANMLYTWRRRYLTERHAKPVGLLPVVLLSDPPTQTLAAPSSALQALDANPAPPAGTIEIRIGRVVVKVDGLVDADMLRTVLGSLRS
ncbi:transposase [Caballeronia sp. EK]|uniref:IS66-like element accessory protein TnpA n=1 Tax=Caballeronia sp. EK TaxID=2767469 RepID=UPI001656243F|nr:transposase [Caballeronia sp. EK]MBC8641958.1 transposase [Caballeronia sp. EK]